jgi:hypothetical protein
LNSFVAESEVLQNYLRIWLLNPVIEERNLVKAATNFPVEADSDFVIFFSSLNLKNKLWVTFFLVSHPPTVNDLDF